MAETSLYSLCVLFYHTSLTRHSHLGCKTCAKPFVILSKAVLCLSLRAEVTRMGLECLWGQGGATYSHNTIYIHISTSIGVVYSGFLLEDEVMRLARGGWDGGRSGQRWNECSVSSPPWLVAWLWMFVITHCTVLPGRTAVWWISTGAKLMS